MSVLSPRRRSAAAVLAVLATALAVTITAPATASPGATATSSKPSKAPKDKIRPDLRKQLDSKDQADFWVAFEAKADLSKAASIKDWNVRGTAVAAALKATAAASQQSVRGTLDSAGVEYQSFWATNAIKVTGGKRALVEALATRAEVASVSPSFKVEPPKVTASGTVAAATASAVEWGVANIRADEVWAQYGVHGEGITIASIDTGTQFDHPALVRQYRGNNGDGTFDHNYNWFDAAGTCGPVPCDNHGHGTHTMGTMVGDDGAGHQIGVAPGAKWITANGCCPDDTALIASGQWMLEPTDLNGQNPDASKRPNIVNNSWGSTTPSDEPILEDISLAWTASGIFGIFANGNSGPACQTSGSPGSRVINYSVGAYDSSNAIASFSSRGSGQDGAIKPDISAPGASILSSLPGDRYEAWDGTSMATPHVAGTIALLWSAAGGLVGDIDETRALLDGTAIDSPDGQCGGTDADNNVFGQGRLDALALLKSAPIGPVGRVAGTATDTAGTPIAGAQITVAGPVTRQLTTTADGAFASGILPIGTYTVSAKKYGYEVPSATVQITQDATSTVALKLVPLPYKTVSGTVTDGSGHGWPLYAKLMIDGYTEGPIFTDPVTGRYSVRLPASTAYQVHVFPQYDGYATSDRTVQLGDADLTYDLSLTADQSSCTAPGYRWNGTGEDFTGWTSGTTDGWTTSGQPAWRFDNPGYRTAPNDGGGRFAIADAAYAGVKRFDTTLTSPAYDLSAQDSPVIAFDTAYYGSSNQRADVDVSVDGGKTWTNVWQKTTGNTFGRVTVALPQAAHRTGVRVRFHYQGRNGNWWALDDVFVGTHACVVTEGGLVVGFAKDTTGASVYATVARTAAAQEKTTTVTTPVDPNLGDGLYWLFSSATGPTELTATAATYTSATATVPVVKNAIVTQDWTLTKVGG
ncbi:S8 family serine peptidase [Hamadaea sp. NPDC051192]|uniref:S8 family serine peptidase n=1 Tax=Hamadaea sp. NPDC051192 TaxID=3154940 RepID=UPI00343CCC07